VVIEVPKTENREIQSRGHGGQVCRAAGGKKETVGKNPPKTKDQGGRKEGESGIVSMVQGAGEKMGFSGKLMRTKGKRAKKKKVKHRLPFRNRRASAGKKEH